MRRSEHVTVFIIIPLRYGHRFWTPCTMDYFHYWSAPSNVTKTVTRHALLRPPSMFMCANSVLSLHLLSVTRLYHLFPNLVPRRLLPTRICSCKVLYYSLDLLTVFRDQYCQFVYTAPLCSLTKDGSFVRFIFHCAMLVGRPKSNPAFLSVSPFSSHYIHVSTDSLVLLGSFF